MPAVVILRVKTYGVEAQQLLKLLERELGVEAQPHTAGYVPLSFDHLDDPDALARVTQVLESSDGDWRDHIELRGA